MHTSIWTFTLLVNGLTAVYSLSLGSDDEKTATIDEFMERVLKCRSIPGWSISIVHNGSVFLTKGYGLADVEEAIPATEDTLFALASITKSFTATSLAQIFADTDG